MKCVCYHLSALLVHTADRQRASTKQKAEKPSFPDFLPFFITVLRWIQTTGRFSSQWLFPIKATLRLNTHLDEIYFNFLLPRFLHLMCKPYTISNTIETPLVVLKSSCCFVLHRKQNFHLLCSSSPLEPLLISKLQFAYRTLNEIPVVCTFLYVTQRKGTVTKNITKIKTLYPK